ncbi:hypothetical protein A5741_07850 [Mycolicibacterium conceptionense]|nr:hypothetical protein A5741_07850 [Mycolicibacterium conceptionense]
MTFAGDFDLRSQFEGPVPFVVAVILLIGIPCAVILCVGGWYSKKADYRKAACLYTFSSAFWARWRGERLWVAPYDDLAAEAARCEEILGSMGLIPPHYDRKESGPVVQANDADKSNRRIDREAPAFRAKRGAVLQAMSHAVAQGRGPQAPPYRV